MAQLIDPIPSHESDLICCCYINISNKMQIVRITNIQGWYFERVVFPKQRLLFESMPEGCLEIHTGMMASAILSDTIPCIKLQVDEDDIVLEPSYTAEGEQQREAENELPKKTKSKDETHSESLFRESLKVHATQAS